MTTKEQLNIRSLLLSSSKSKKLVICDWLLEEEQYNVVLKMVCERICKPLLEHGSSQWHLPNEFYANVCKELLNAEKIHDTFLAQLKSAWKNQNEKDEEDDEEEEQEPESEREPEREQEEQEREQNQYLQQVWLQQFIEWMHPHVSMHMQMMKWFDEEFALWFKYVFSNIKLQEKMTTTFNDTFKVFLHQQKSSLLPSLTPSAENA
ncbi:hypothetical protein RFI_04576 [Reticulomyxa filosa]|uniref:Uncharacterized protein n=1 Tax=Reticulomyxa filosa TaxID=46433 RepID=X6P1X0_RETFI|nr:hypothetical protein RFI_04576 [Reticulomyxa filosa]|eukprot:ETO32540.1 hypothetical protein RFI_04576 [Reticulomyxa filosa]